MRNVVATGIDYEPLLPGLVPLFEEREAAVFGHFNWRDWRTLEPEDRAAAVAHYRMHHMVEQHHADALNTAMERRARQQQAG